MAIKITVYAIGASLAMLGCAHDPRTMSPQTCSSAQCAVPVGQSDGCWPFNHAVAPSEILVNVPRPMTITWTLDSTAPPATHWNPSSGIKFDQKSEGYFKCSPSGPNPTEPRAYSCENNAPAGPHKYTIKTKGWCSPPDLDPTVVNN